MTPLAPIPAALSAASAFAGAGRGGERRSYADAENAEPRPSHRAEGRREPGAFEAAGGKGHHLRATCPRKEKSSLSLSPPAAATALLRRRLPRQKRNDFVLRACLIMNPHPGEAPPSATAAAAAAADAERERERERERGGRCGGAPV